MITDTVLRGEILAVLTHLARHEASVTVAAAADELERLWAIVDTFPALEDGVRLLPGTKSWCNERTPFAHGWELRLRNGETLEEHCRRSGEKHYSTPAAAKAEN